MAKHAMPVSKAKTAYGLLSEIRKIILEEPKRYDQWGLLSTGARAKAHYGTLTPSCGTVGCVAGWVVALKSPRSREIATVRAGQVLGLDGMCQRSELFAGSKAGDRDDITAHARRGAAHIAKFQKKYAKQLKAKKV